MVALLLCLSALAWMATYKGDTVKALGAPVTLRGPVRGAGPPLALRAEGASPEGAASSRTPTALCPERSPLLRELTTSPGNIVDT